MLSTLGALAGGAIIAGVVLWLASRARAFNGDEGDE